MKRSSRRNPSKGGWFAIGTAAGITASVLTGAGYLFWRLTKL